MSSNRDPAHRRRLTVEDWTDAALRALREGGLAAVSIEPLATRLGTTKGSAYWHFANREALLRATLERWESEETERVIALVDTEADPVDRLRVLFASVLKYAGENSVELSLTQHADDPTIGPVLARVTERRVDYLTALFRDVGFGRAQARRRALLAYTTYLGHAQLDAAAPGVLPRRRAESRAYAEQLLRVLLDTDEAGTNES